MPEWFQKYLSNLDPDQKEEFWNWFEDNPYATNEIIEAIIGGVSPFTMGSPNGCSSLPN
jgi:hypothetical protein